MRRRARVTAAVDRYHQAACALLGAAHAGVTAAEWARVDAATELALLQRAPGAAHTIPKGSEAAAERVTAGRRRMFARWAAHGPHAAATAVSAGAPGPAGEPYETWLGQVGKADGGPPHPELWHIGEAHLTGQRDVSWPAALPLLDHTHLHITADPATRSHAEGLVEALLLRVMSTLRPGLVRVHVWDVGEIRGTLPGLYQLTTTELMTVHGPEHLADLLRVLADRIERVRTTVLAGGQRSIADASGDDERAEPWHVAVVVGNGQPLPDGQVRALQRVARGGVPAGVHLILLDVPVELPGPVETVTVTPGRVATSLTGPHADVVLDDPPDLVTARQACAAITAWWVEWCTRTVSFPDLLPAKLGTCSAAEGVTAPVGFTVDGQPVMATLDDASPHALIAGPSGSGKSCLLLAWMGSMAARYSPDELELYMLDFKEGVSFAQLAPSAVDPSWLPHARLVGVNINSDREFGVALLAHLAEVMKARAAAARAVGATKLSELRAKDPDGHWPRIVAVIDEFQLMLDGPDSKAALALLDDLARRGRSQGIHLVLATQDTGSIKALWGQGSVLEQFVLRIALPRARRVMASMNDAALALPRWHAVINAESGHTHGNEIARIPNAVAAGTFDELQQRLHAAYPGKPPVLLDGDTAPPLAALAGAGAALGQSMTVSGGPAVMPLPPLAGRNLAILGGPGDAGRILTAAVITAARDGAEVLVASPTRSVDADRLAAMTGTEVVELTGAFLAQLAEALTERGEEDPPVVVALVGAPDAGSLDRPGLQALQRLLHDGPARGVHVMGWWSSIQRLRSVLPGSAIDDIGCWAATDVHGGELGPLIPGTATSTWSPRPGRALWMDRSCHAYPQVLIVPDVGGEQ